MTLADLAAKIDHTALKPETTIVQIEQLCREAVANGFAAVCINPVFVSMSARMLEGQAPKVCTVVGFPLGAMTSEAKAAEAREAIRLGAREVDMVLWVGGLKSGRFDWVQDDISRVADACRREGALLKVILECALLTDDEKKRACELCMSAGAHFVKTSTGYGFVKGADGKYSYQGATEHDIKLMRANCSPKVQVKAAGGVRDLDMLIRMRDWGCSRCGASATAAILDEYKKRAAAGL